MSNCLRLCLSICLCLSILLCLPKEAAAQLPNGSIAPNWTLTDINGNTYTLYNILNQGKMVVLDFGETRCTPCWNYLNSGQLETFWEQHGPNGLDDAMVFFIESAWYTGMDDLLGLTPYSNGNWIAACPFPLIDLPDGNNTANNYDVNYYPTIFAVCHDHTLYELGTVPTQDWVDFLESCNMEVEVADLETATCAGEGSVTVEPSGGFSPYTYQWNNGAIVPMIGDLISGFYNVTVTEGNGKISKLQVFVPGAIEALSLENEIEPALCFGSANGNILVDVQGGIPGYAYHWNTGATTQNLLQVSSGIYHVTVTDNLGCTMEQSLFVSQPTLLSVTAVTTPVSCDQPDGTITLSITGGVGTYTISSSQGTIIGNQIVGLGAGLISVEVEDEHGCIWSQQVLTHYIDSPAVSVTEGAQVNCIQTSATLLGFATGGYNEFDFQWTTSDGHILTNAQIAQITVDAPGAYLLHVTDLTSGCETFTTSVVASGVIIPNVDAGPGIPINCENLQVTLAGSGDVSNVILWSTPDGSIIAGGNTYQPIVDSIGTYIIHVVNSITNCINQDSVLIMNESVPAISAFQYLISGLTVAGMDLSTGSNLSGWNWTFGDGLASAEQNPVHTYLTSGTYEVCLTVQNGCGISQSCQMVEANLSVSPLTADVVITDVNCFGDRTGQINVTVNGGSGIYNYNWTGPDTTYTSSQIDSLPAGAFQLIVSDSLGNIFIYSYQVNQPSQLISAGDSIVNNQCYGYSAGSISLVMEGGIPPYQFAWNGGIPQADNFLDSLSSGTVQAMVIDSNGCIFDAGIFTITEPDSISLVSILITDASGANANDGAITLTVKGGTPPYSVNWSNGANGLTIAGLFPGAYDYTVTDANGCQYTSPEPLQVLFITTTNEVEYNPKITIAPNPVKDNVIIHWNNIQSGEASLTLMTLEGKKLAMHQIESGNGMWEISSASLPEGLYIILLKQEGEVIPYRFVKM